MKYLDFRNTIDRPLFRRHDVDVARLQIYNSQLSRWVKEGKLRAVARGVYAFSDRHASVHPFTIATMLYEPSYVSLESALYTYQLIPDIPQITTLVTSNTTRRRTTLYGKCMYRHVLPGLFFGYTRVGSGAGSYLLADAEKAVLDFLYFNASRIETLEDVDALRINTDAWRTVIHQEKLGQYAVPFLSTPQSAHISRALTLLQTYVNTH